MRFGIPDPDYRIVIDNSNANNSDIVKSVEKNFSKAVSQTKDFAKLFQSPTAKETAHKVWKFLKDQINYQKDSEKKQIIQLPSYLIYSKNGDCKSYSLLAASTLYNAKLPVAFRYASYNRFNKVPSHVYVVTYDEKGNEIIVDGVWTKFNDQKPPTYQYTHPMEVISMSGSDEVSGIGRRKRRGGFLSFAKKLALAPNRRAFRTLVAINLFGLARKLQRIRMKNPKGLEKFWVRTLGGKYSELLKSIKKGYNHWAKRHKKQRINGIEYCVAGSGYYQEQREIVSPSGLGAAPALAAVISAAAPVITAIASLAKKSGANKPEPGEPPFTEVVERSKEIQSNVPNPESTVNGLIEGLQIGSLQIGDLTIGRRKRQGKFLERINRIRLAPARRAFRTLISINFGGLAYKLKRASIKDPKELEAKWRKMGGKYPALMQSINRGYRLMPKKLRLKGIKGIGEDAAAPTEKDKATGWAALAATVIKALAGLFKKHDKNSDGTSSPGESLVEKITDTAVTAAENFGIIHKPATELIDEGKADTTGSDEPKKSLFTPSNLLIAGVIGAGILLLSSRKK
jgi:hypothetical protein